MSTSIAAEPAPDGIVDPLDDAGPGAARTQRELIWSRLKRDRVAMVSLVFLGLLVLAAVLANPLVHLLGLPGPTFRNTTALDDFGQPSGPTGANPFGVDQYGRDIASRVLYGAQISLAVAVGSTAISVVFGVLVGTLAGYFRGWVDTVVSRVLDVLLAFPILMLGIGLASACTIGKGCLGGLITPGVPVVVIIIAIAGFPFIARIVRGQVLSLREKEFVSAARSIGASHPRIMLRHVVPNLVAPIIVYSTVLVPQNILFEASLSFLGVGVQDPTSSWGQMLGDASRNTDQWWFMLFPGLALLLTVLAFNLLGDGLQDALDPRRRT